MRSAGAVGSRFAVLAGWDVCERWMPLSPFAFASGSLVTDAKRCGTGSTSGKSTVGSFVTRTSPPIGFDPRQPETMRATASVKMIHGCRQACIRASLCKTCCEDDARRRASRRERDPTLGLPGPYDMSSSLSNAKCHATGTLPQARRWIPIAVFATIQTGLSASLKRHHCVHDVFAGIRSKIIITALGAWARTRSPLVGIGFSGPMRY